MPRRERERLFAYHPDLSSRLRLWIVVGNFELRVVNPNDFKAYLQQRIAGKTNAEALAAIDQPPTAITTHPFDTRRGEQAGSPAQASK